MKTVIRYKYYKFCNQSFSIVSSIPHRCDLSMIITYETLTTDLNMTLDKQIITTQPTRPCLPSLPQTGPLTINLPNQSEEMMADMFIGCICSLQIPDLLQ